MPNNSSALPLKSKARGARLVPVIMMQSFQSKVGDFTRKKKITIGDETLAGSLLNTVKAISKHRWNTQARTQVMVGNTHLN